jgi:hypothetical protein
MWTSNTDNERMLSVVYFLADTLASILEDGEELKEIRCAPPVIEGHTSCEDIMSRLGNFRNNVNDIRGREAIMIAKLSRAREWALMLRDIAPEIRPEISVFLLGTVFCKELQQAVTPCAQRSFHGGMLARMFLNERLKTEPGHGDAGARYAYMIAGKVHVEYLLNTCKSFMETLEEYFHLYAMEEDDAADVAELAEPEAGELRLTDQSGASGSAGLVVH